MISTPQPAAIAARQLRHTDPELAEKVGGLAPDTTVILGNGTISTAPQSNMGRAMRKYDRHNILVGSFDPDKSAFNWGLY